MLASYRAHSAFQNYRLLRADPMTFLTGVAQSCGDFARFNVLTLPYYFINDPKLVRQALVEHSESLIIAGGVSRGLARLIGHGILTNRGDDWRKSREQLQPLFRQAAITASLPVMATRVHESLERWRTQLGRTTFSLNRELLALSCRITCSTLFGYLPSFDEALAFADAIWVLQLDGMQRFMAGEDYLPWLPLPRNRRVNAAMHTLLQLAEAAAAQGPTPSVDEIRSILFAGTESPVNTLCFALQLLAQHPTWRDRLLQELAPLSTADQLDRAPLLTQVVSECMRLYPAGWAFERYAAVDTPLGDTLLKKGARLLFSPFHLHRNPRLWSDPDKFDPTRFAGSQSATGGVEKFGYLPFGAGPRSCIGSRVAQAEMRITLGLILKAARFTLQPSATESPVQPLGSFKIRLDRPMLVQMTALTTDTPPAAPRPTQTTASS